MDVIVPMNSSEIEVPLTSKPESLSRRSVFSISPAGSLALVRAAAIGGGPHQRDAVALLEAEYRQNISVIEAKDLAQRCLLKLAEQEVRAADIEANDTHHEAEKTMKDLSTRFLAMVEI